MLKKICLLSFLVLPFRIAAPEAAAPDGFEHWSASQISDLGKALAAKSAVDAHHAAVQKLADFKQDYFLLANRQGPGLAEWHENEADVFVVQSGSATLTIGGTLVDPDTTAPHEKRSAAISGGTQQKLIAGDIVRIPAGLPHQLAVDPGQQFTYLVVKVKGY